MVLLIVLLDIIDVKLYNYTYMQTDIKWILWYVTMCIMCTITLTTHQKLK